MIAWIRGGAFWTSADTYIAGICVFLFIDVFLIIIRRRGLPYHLALLLIALDAAQMAIVQMFIPVCTLWVEAFVRQVNNTLPSIETAKERKTRGE